MKVLVDTSIWSLAFRRRNPVRNAHVTELEMLVEEMRIQMIGPVRQEILSGISVESHYLKLKSRLNRFPDFPLKTEDYELAAEFFNKNRKNGIQGSNTDFLICAVAQRCEMPIFTTDQDFLNFSKHIPIRFHQPRR